MRNLTNCSSQHAIKVCSRPSNHPILPLNITPSIQNAVTCLYRVNFNNAQNQILVTVTWCRIMNQKFSVTFVDDPSSHFKFNTSILQSGKIKGTKSFESANVKVEIIWDLSSAKYAAGPEPVSGFYVSILFNSELILFLGDMEEEVRVKKFVPNNIPSSKFSLVSRSEHFSGSGVYATKAKFFDYGTCHDILIECIAEDKGNRNLMLCVGIDKKNVIKVKKLQWNFRGNHTLFIDGGLVDMMWDVHDWFFNQKSGYGIFMFRPRNGLDSRLWLEEKKLEQQNEQERAGFSLLICARKNL